MNLDPFVTFVLIAMFIVWFYGPWQETCADYARQIIFEQRDRLFDLAAEGKIAFSSKEYTTIRGSLNSAIRYCHEMTAARIAFIWISYKFKHIGPTHSDMYNARENISDENLRNLVESIEMRSFAAMAVSMLFRSLLFVVFATITSPFILGGILLYFWWVGFMITIKGFARRFSAFIGEIIQIEAECDCR